MAKDGTQLCYLLVVIVSIGFLVWGFMDLLRPKLPSEKAQVDVISRQIRGFAFIMVSQVVLVLGSIICFGMTGGVKGLGKTLKKVQLRI
uniref:Transmembrane protein n=1 Tax=Marseillevirus LCMAC102 TaxID=2506603 RepID=A0A481YVN7_9VIRU|nr:MAG: uncharacterized protein LCMAC102_04100 [Marseillevirus LCMAC102]